MTSSPIAELDAFLASDEADLGMTPHARQLISDLLSNEDDPFRYFVNILLSPPQTPPASSENNIDGENNESKSSSSFDENIKHHATISYRAMNMLKQDLSTANSSPMMMGGGSALPVLVKNASHAGLLAKDLLYGLGSGDDIGANGSAQTASSSMHTSSYTTYHIRELLDSLLEAYPEKVMSAASAGGKEGVQTHLEPLMNTDQTLSILTHLVCYGCTGRKGIASAEKSAQHTQNMYHPMFSNQNTGPKISLGQRKKFVKAIADFQLLDQLAGKLSKSTIATTTIGSGDGEEKSEIGIENNSPPGEEICESILTILEVIGYPPDESTNNTLANRLPQSTTTESNNEVSVGENVLLSPLSNPEWWNSLLKNIATSSVEQKGSIARTCYQTFALATGSSSRICKSHAPATDATEQASENIVEEREEQITNKLVEYGLTANIHAALIQQIPTLVQQLQLPQEKILDYQATTSTISGGGEEEQKEDPSIIRHPGRYQTIPLGSWRLQLLALLKEIVAYSGGVGSSDEENDGAHGGSSAAMDALMRLPVPSEILAKKKKKGISSEGDAAMSVQSPPEGPWNPWPALCTFLWAYPNNDFYHHTFYQMLQAVVLAHHEPTLRLILQKSKFLTKAVRSFSEAGPMRGTLLDCLNLLRLRSASLPPSAFLHQYLGSHDGWKENSDRLLEVTLSQQTPIKRNDGDTSEISIDLGSAYASKLGLAGLSEYDHEAAAAVEAVTKSNILEQQWEGDEQGQQENNKKKKKKKKKKKLSHRLLQQSGMCLFQSVCATASPKYESVLPSCSVATQTLIGMKNGRSVSRVCGLTSEKAKSSILSFKKRNDSILCLSVRVIASRSIE